MPSFTQILPYFVMDALGGHTGVPGVFVTGIFMASLSSVSSGINALSSVFYVDVIALWKPNLSNEAGSRIMTGLGTFATPDSFGRALNLSSSYIDRFLS